MWRVASAPARVDLAGGTLDLWPLHVLHPGSVTVNLAISLRAECQVRPAERGFRVRSEQRGLDCTVQTRSALFGEPGAELVGSLLEALDVVKPVEIELRSEVPFGSGLGGSSALTVATAAALMPFARRPRDASDFVPLVRDVETRVLRKPAGVQDYYPPLAGALHRLFFDAGCTRADRLPVDPGDWDRHLTVFDTGVSHSSGMNNWEIFRARLEGDAAVTESLEAVRLAAVRMSAAVARLDFEEMGSALAEEWEARRRLAPVVSSERIEVAIEAARRGGAWAGKACGAGGGGCVLILSPQDRTAEVRAALARLGRGAVLEVRAEPGGLAVREG